MSYNKVIVYAVIVSWAFIICLLLFLQFTSFQQLKELQKISISQAIEIQQLKELQKISISQAIEIQQLKEEVNHISFASLDSNIPINSKKLVLDNNNYRLENYYNLEKLRISSGYFHIESRYGNILDLENKLKITNNNVKLLMIEGPYDDILTIVKQFPNVEELIIIFNNNNPDKKSVDLSHIIYPSKIKKIVLIKMNQISIGGDISPVVSYYRQQNKEVVIDETDNIGDLYTKYDLWN